MKREDVHQPWVDWEPLDGLYVVYCRGGSCRRGSNAPTVLGAVPGDAEAFRLKAEHAKEADRDRWRIKDSRP